MSSRDARAREIMKAIATVLLSEGKLRAGGAPGISSKLRGTSRPAGRGESARGSDLGSQASYVRTDMLSRHP
jgi:hypothetical protein